MRLLYDTSAAIADYKKSPAWLKQLLNAFADGINYYLYKNPGTKPALLKRFEPWFPLLFTDGGYTAMQTGGLEMEDIKNLYSAGWGIEALSLKQRNQFSERDQRVPTRLRLHLRKPLLKKQCCI